jgi:hypothetical protein
MQRKEQVGRKKIRVMHKQFHFFFRRVSPMEEKKILALKE